MELGAPHRLAQLRADSALENSGQSRLLSNLELELGQEQEQTSNLELQQRISLQEEEQESENYPQEARNPLFSLGKTPLQGS